jgi:hypothetical protein
MNKLEIVKALLSDKDETTVSESVYGGSKIKIAILQRGWVFIGKFSKEGDVCKLTDAYNIRTWGTTKGLGELAEGGSTSTTKLDKVNDVMFHELGIVCLIDCNDIVWKKLI